MRMVDRSRQPDERNSSNAQIRTLLEEQRQMIIAEYREKVGHHELQAAHAEEERRLLQGQLLRQKLEFREAHQQSLTEMEELRKCQSSAFDTIARRKLIEDQNTILELSSRVQELQNEVNCMNESKDFQDAESVRSGNSYVTSRPVSFPPHPILDRKIRTRNSSIWQESTTRNLFLAMSRSREEFGKEIFLIADLEELSKLDASDIYLRRINAKQVSITQTDDEFVFPLAGGTAKLSGRDYEFREPALRQKSIVTSEDLSGELQSKSEESRPSETTDDVEVRADLWSIQGHFICRHHNERRVQLYVPKEELFPIPLKYIDFTRSTHTDQDVMQENALTISAMSIRTDTWRNLLHRKRSLQWCTCGPGGD